MVYGLTEAGVLVRICYYAGELSLLAVQPGMLEKMIASKTALDEAWRELLTQKECHARSN